MKSKEELAKPPGAVEEEQQQVPSKRGRGRPKKVVPKPSVDEEVKAQPAASKQKEEVKPVASNGKHTLKNVNQSNGGNKTSKTRVAAPKPEKKADGISSEKENGSKPSDPHLQLKLNYTIVEADQTRQIVRAADLGGRYMLPGEAQKDEEEEDGEYEDGED
uniref:High mobility group nucleosome-binding domain-containing protein 3 n=1 Tax=Panagrolaimus davidi TaxID=227884 RepID=A0A914P7T9_9BILA